MKPPASLRLRAAAALAALVTPLPAAGQAGGLEELLEQARTAIAIGHYHPVQVALTQALAQVPDDPRVALLLAEALHRDGQQEPARALAERVLRENPDHLPAAATLARTLVAFGFAERAGAAVERLRALEPAPDWSLPLSGFLRLAGADAEGCLRDTAATAFSAEAEALRRDLRGVCALLVGGDALRTFIETDGDGRPEEVLRLYAAAFGSGADLQEALGALPPDLGERPWVLRLRLGVADLRGDRPARSAVLAALREAQPAEAAWKIALARDDFEERRYEDCIGKLRTWFADEPMSYPTVLMAGRALAAVDRCDEAVPMLRVYLGTDPQNPDGNTALGGCLAAGGETEGAEAAYRRALGLDPRNRPAAVGLAALLRRSGRDAEAKRLVADFERVHREARERERLVRALRLARTAAASERWEDLERHAREATELDPDNVEAHAMRAVAAVGRGDTAAARATFERVLEIDPGNERVRRDLAALAGAEGDRARAIALLEEQLERFPEAGDSLDGLVALYREEGDLERALARVDAVVAARPRAAQAHRLRAELLHDLERFEEGLAAARRATELAPDDPGVWQRLLVLADRAGDADAARHARAEMQRLRR